MSRLRRSAVVLALALAGMLLPAPPAAANECQIRQAPVFPGDSVSVHCEIVNLSPPDARFFWHVDADTLVVLDEDDNVITDSRRGTFLSFFTISLDRQRVYTAANPLGEERDNIDLLKTPYPEYRRTCHERPIGELHGTSLFTDACDIGRVRGTAYGGPELLQSFQRRAFELTLTFVSDGTDKSEFAGWAVAFDAKVVAMASAPTDCPAEGCLPVYER